MLPTVDSGDRDDRLVLEADRWAIEHRDVLSQCFERFELTGIWATLEELQLDLAADGQEIDIAEVARSMPSLLGVVDRERLELSVGGMSKIPGALPVLEVWAWLLRTACDRLTQGGVRAEINLKDIAMACNGDMTLVSCVVMILMREPWPRTSGQGSFGGNLFIEFDESVLEIRDAYTLADVLKARGPVQSRPLPTLAEMLKPPPAAP